MPLWWHASRRLIVTSVVKQKNDLKVNTATNAATNDNAAKTVKPANLKNVLGLLRP